MDAKRIDDLSWRPSPLAEIGRYAFAAIIVSTLAASGVFVLARMPDGAPAVDTDEAVLVDLPPALASSAPRRDVAEGPQEQAIAATAAVPRTEATKTDMPPEDVKPADEGEMTTPEKTEAPPPLPPMTAAPAQDETGVSGSDAKPQPDPPATSEAARARAAKAISLWQRAMLSRLEIAKSGMRTGGEYGTVDIAFSIDGAGRLLASRIARGSGSARLDRTALLLIQRASPYPMPPEGLTPLDLSFRVPIVFGRRPGAP